MANFTLSTPQVCTPPADDSSGANIKTSPSAKDASPQSQETALTSTNMNGSLPIPPTHFRLPGNHSSPSRSSSTTLNSQADSSPSPTNIADFPLLDHSEEPPSACLRLDDPTPTSLLMTKGHTRPERDTCPKCRLKISFDLSINSRNHACCMKRLCTGCILEAHWQGVNDTCPSCEKPKPDSDASSLAMLRAHAERGDAAAIGYIGQMYSFGALGLRKNGLDAIEWWTMAAELGDADSQYDLGLAYYDGDGVEQDKARGIRYWQQAAMQGQSDARHGLGLAELGRLNHDLAVQHWLISAQMGYEKSLTTIKFLYMNGKATKEQYANALKGYQDAVEEMKSPRRIRAKAFFESLHS